MLLFCVNCKIPSAIDSVATALFPKRLIQAAIFIGTRVWLIMVFHHLQLAHWPILRTSFWATMPLIWNVNLVKTETHQFAVPLGNICTLFLIMGYIHEQGVPKNALSEGCWSCSARFRTPCMYKGLRMQIWLVWVPTALRHLSVVREFCMSPSVKRRAGSRTMEFGDENFGGMRTLF